MIDIASVRRSTLAAWLFALCAIAWLWLTLINQLRVEWSLNPQYAYGWAVPFLCAYLLWNRMSEAGGQRAGSGDSSGSVFRCFSVSVFQWFSVSAFVLLALLYFPVRLVQEANPEWRLVSWALALITVGISLLLVAWIEELQNHNGNYSSLITNTQNSSTLSAFRFPHFRVSTLAFPILFFLVAVPWPTVIEGPLIQWLTQANAGATIEILSLIGVPAIQHGNVIEVGTGVVGIDEACSGIRSFQAALMISLFFGELYRLATVGRLLLCLAGFTLSFVFNVVRTTLLTWVAARDGVEAIADWHDPAGVTILVGCFIGVWLSGLWLNSRNVGMPKAESGDSESPKERNTETQKHGDLSPTPQLATADNSPPMIHNSLSVSAFRLSAFGLVAWLVFTEISVEAWYRAHERDLPQPLTWTVDWPEENATFEELSLAERTTQILRYDEGRNARWIDSAGRNWQVIFLRWDPGRTAVHLAKNHTPEACLAAVGFDPVMDPELHLIEVNGLVLPFRHYTLDIPGAPTHVYYCLWEDRADREDRRFEAMSLSYANRLEPVLAGRRLTGQRSLEVVLTGVSDAEEAEAALQRALEQWINVEQGMSAEQGSGER